MNDVFNPTNRIKEIASQLSKEGIDVSTSSVRQMMEGRESYSKIYHDLAEWRQNRPKVNAEPEAPVLDNVENTMSSVMQVIWNAASVQARADIHKLREMLKSQAEVLQRDLGDALAEISRLENENQYQANKIEELSIGLQESEANVSSRETEMSTLRKHYDDIIRRERDLVNRIEELAARAAAAEAELRIVRPRKMHISEGVEGETLPPSH